MSNQEPTKPPQVGQSALTGVLECGTTGTWHFCWIGEKRYGRETTVTGQAEYHVNGKDYRWRSLPSRCKKVMAEVDAAIDAQQSNEHSSGDQCRRDEL